jgi:hypothetical protein
MRTMSALPLMVRLGRQVNVNIAFSAAVLGIAARARSARGIAQAAPHPFVTVTSASV